MTHLITMLGASVAAAIILVATALIGRVTLTDRRTMGWVAIAAALAVVPAVIWSDPGTLVAATLLVICLWALASAPAAWRWPFAAAAALVALVVSPSVGVAALAMTSWRTPRAWYPFATALAGAVVIVALDLDPTKRLLMILAGAVVVAWAGSNRTPTIGRIPDSTATFVLLRAGIALGVIGLLVIDGNGLVLPPDAFWLAIVYAAAVGALGAAAAVVAVGAWTLAAVRDDARGLVFGLCLVAPLVALLSWRAAAAAVLPAGALMFGVGLARVEALAVPAARVLARKIVTTTSPRRPKRG